ncbi:MAG: 16S rRNA (adenine(1518)-N(6)/adenine(1519)-N(6))-dimethyltransferase RsmA [Pyrinomonadaceae bacterium]
MRPRKSLGQNFLCDEGVILRIVDALKVENTDTVIEIGPGTGALTRGLVEKAGRVIAVEFDRELIPGLENQFAAHTNFELINRDALSYNFEDLLGNDVDTPRAKLVANLPYNISTPILQRLIEQRFLFSELVLMFQREVVERITATPGGKDRGYLSVIVENAFKSERVMDVAPGAFYPVPRVWSAVVRLVPKVSSAGDERLFRKLVSQSFAQRRKTLLNNLKSMLPDAAAVLSRSGIDGKRRAETLTLQEWCTLTQVMADTKKPGVHE